MFTFSKSPPSSQGRRTSSDSRSIERPPSSHAGHSNYQSSSDELNYSERPRGYVENFRRSSVLGVRARSNTTNSGSTNHSITPSMSSTAVSSRRSSQDGRSMSISGLSRWNSSEGSAKALFSRGSRVLRRNNSRMNLFAMSNDKPDEIEELANRRKSQLWQSGFLSKGDQNDTHAARKRTISEPFNFQHLTHTKAQHFPELDRTSQRELVTEFSAIRAAQAPRKQLEGIRADDLHFRNFSTEAINACPLLDNPPDLSGHSRHERFDPAEESERNLQSPLGHHRDVQHTRSADSVSQPSPPRSPEAVADPVTPPPRRFSRVAFGSYSRPSGQSSPTSPSFSRPHTSSGFRDARPFNFSMLCSNSPKSPSSGRALEVFDDDPEIPHAMTTPDETAMELRAPSFGCGTELADVPEEEEGAFCFRRSVRPFPIDSPALLSPYDLSDIDPLSQLDPPQFPESTIQHRARPLSQASDTLGAPFSGTPNFQLSGTSPIVRGNFSPALPTDGCWEDDIDYCYEHAAEADCDFEWSRLPNEASVPKGAAQSQHTAQAHLDQSRYNVSSDTHKDSAPGPLPTFEFAEPQAQAALAAGPGPAEAEGFSLSPSLLIPKDYEDQMLREALYEELLSSNPDVQQHFPFFAPSLARPESGCVSYRSSRTSPSKCDSQDSFNFSVGQQSLSSRSSVLDLVHSHPCKEVFDEAALRLADQIASLNASGSETSSLHRNGSLNQHSEHASSASPYLTQQDDEAHESKLPRRQRSSSDGASALLSRAIDGKNGRTRSASSAGSRRASRVSYNLFPAPPRHLPQ
ncbi:hypothetical protein L228DRAFT_241816 [Xylona heveae TC161]|uniref:CRIB domain-containing protein n=1 Tax=Xylona heveae (strain CBS 132557 / TC161) TaxID=1328760 RepID=A0A164ZIE7_XYLHT|nr:hypothetical protein L228DRAFT_241816 [Xylona heveae TC161]KZF19138.1 hypothetical protein L228DRAFT_241816 [Xylona heveae TC161]